MRNGTTDCARKLLIDCVVTGFAVARSSKLTRWARRAYRKVAASDVPTPSSPRSARPYQSLSSRRKRYDVGVNGVNDVFRWFPNHLLEEQIRGVERAEKGSPDIIRRRRVRMMSRKSKERGNKHVRRMAKGKRGGKEGERTNTNTTTTWSPPGRPNPTEIKCKSAIHPSSTCCARWHEMGVRPMNERNVRHERKKH